MKLKHVILRSMGTKQFFTSLLGSFLIVILIPTITAIVLAITSLSLINRQVDETYKVLFKNITQETERVFSSAITLTQKTSQNQNLVSYAASSKRNYFSEYKLIETLQNSVFGAPYIQMMYTYLPQYDYVLANTGGNRGRDFFTSKYTGLDYGSWKEMMLQATPYPHIVFLKDKKNDSNVPSYVFVIRQVITSNITGSDEGVPVLVTQLDFADLKSSIAALNRNSDDRALIYSGDNIIATTFNEKSANQIIRIISDTSGISTEPKYTGNSREVSLEGSQKYQLYQNTITYNNIGFIYAVSKKVLNSGLSFSRNFALVTLIFCIVTTIWLAIILAARKTTPIMKVFNLLNEENRDNSILSASLEESVAAYVIKHRQMKDTFQSYANDFRDIYLGRLLRGKITGNQSVKQSVFNLYGIAFAGDSYAVAILTPEEPAMILDADDWTERDHNILSKSVIESTFNHVSKGKAVCYVINMEDTDQYICLLNGEGALSNTQSSFYLMLTKTLRIVGNNLSLNYHSFISKSYPSIDNINEAFLEAQNKAVKYEKSIAPRMEQCTKPGLIQKGFDFIKENYHDSNLSVVNIAAALNISSSYLSRNFKEEVGIGLLDYIHQYRVVEAKKIIEQNPNALIKNIAETTGFYSVASMIRVFKKLEGITPGEYRDSLFNA